MRCIGVIMNNLIIILDQAADQMVLLPHPPFGSLVGSACPMPLRRTAVMAFEAAGCYS